MLFRAALLDRIKAGEVTLAFRRWRRPTVKAGGRLRTAIGELTIDTLDTCTADVISEADARAAGFATRAGLLAELDARQEGDIYRIAFRFDRGSGGAWTRPVLNHIALHEGQPAADIASAFGVEKAALKQNIRKLKELGLTESLETGYRLSPRGKALLGALPG
jgi:biotin operon repressor